MVKKIPQLFKGHVPTMGKADIQIPKKLKPAGVTRLPMGVKGKKGKIPSC